MRNSLLLLALVLCVACGGQPSNAVYTGSSDLSEVDTGLGRLPVYKGVGGRLTVSKAELEIWKKRSTSGPYRLIGDAGTHTPGDWTRIRSYADDFIRSPLDSGNTAEEQLDIWTGYTQQIDSLDEYPVWQGIKMQAAAFAYLVANDEQAGQAAKSTLLAQVRLPSANYRVGYPVSSWTVPLGSQQKPTFESGTKECVWLTRLALTYDYILPLLAENECREVVDYFRGAARYFTKRAQKRFEGCFPDRAKADYTARTYLANPKGVPQFGSEPIYEPAGDNDPIAYGARLYTHTKADGHLGNPISRLALNYNNRCAERMTFILLAGLLARDEYLIREATTYQKEWLMFSVYPDGTFGEYERNGNYGNPSQGAIWYGALCLQSYVLSADWLLRAGRENLYTFSTRVGAHGTHVGAGKSPKTFKAALDRFANNFSGVEPIYYGEVEPQNRIDNNNENPKAIYTTHCTFDYILALANRHYKSSTYTAIYQRKAKGTIPYPAKSLSSAAKVWVPWGGTGAEVPGWLFMYGE